MKKNKYFEIGDIVNTKSGEQGIVVEILDNVWVNILQCTGHVDRISVNDIWKANIKIDGKAELNILFLKIFGYSGVYDDDEPNENSEKASEEADFIEYEPNEEIPS